MNRYNSEDIHFRSMNQRSLEARNFTLSNAFSFIPIRLPVPEISSCKAKGNFRSFTISVLVAYSDLSLAPRLTDLSQNPDKRQTRFLENAFREKIYRSLDGATIQYLCITLNTMNNLNLYISATDWDIEIIQKATSTACFSLLSDWILTTKFSFLCLFTRRLKFHLWLFTNALMRYRDAKHLMI